MEQNKVAVSRKEAQHILNRGERTIDRLLKKGDLHYYNEQEHTISIESIVAFGKNKGITLNLPQTSQTKTQTKQQTEVENIDKKADSSSHKTDDRTDIVAELRKVIEDKNKEIEWLRGEHSNLLRITQGTDKPQTHIDKMTIIVSICSILLIVGLVGVLIYFR